MPENKTIGYLTCAGCGFPFERFTGAGVNCPRCNQWLETDAGCSGSCLSCHNTESQTKFSCLDGLDERYSSGVVKR